MSKPMQCPLCGHLYAADEAASLCARCPLSGGCRLVCCPSCGHSTVDDSTSAAASWLASKLRKPVHRSPRASAGNGARPLGTLPSGTTALIRDFDPRMSPQHRQRLQALGIAPGSAVTVVQQSGATIFQVDYTELAVEREVSDLILVELSP